MKSWICNNLFGEKADDVCTFGMISGCGILVFLLSSVFYFFVYIPLVYFGC